MVREYKYIDLTYLESIADGDKDIIKELIEIFLDQVSEFTEGFTLYLSNKDWAKIAAVAHKAKSSVVSMGMEELGNKHLKNLELLAKQVRIQELENANSPDTVNELETLRKSMVGYPEERISWVKQNIDNGTIEKLIDTFSTTCEKAVEELNNVLQTY